MRLNTCFCLVVTLTLILEAESQYFRRKKKLVVVPSSANVDEELPQENRAAVEDETVDDLRQELTRKVFRKKKVLPKITNTLEEAPIPIRASTSSTANQGYIRRKIVKPFIPQESVTPQTTAQPNYISTEAQALNRTQDDPRFLSLFTIVSFKNDACVSGAGNNGTCYSSSDCSRLGGRASGSCASGFGVCCLFTKTCGESTSNNCTYFQNSGYPSTYDSVGSCQLTVNKCNSNVCQLRLDFDNFVIAQPESTDNQCQDDQLIISGGSPIPAICGTNSGVHMYVDMGLSTNNPITLTVVTSGISFSRSFSIKVTQIECTSLAKASDGCLQYHTGVAGEIHSFNYNSAQGLMLSNTDYSICVRMERNFCGIQYTACIDTSIKTIATNNNNNNQANTISMSFSITGGSPTMGSVVGTNCATDWINIPCATNSNDPTTQTGTPSVCVDRICGMVFNSATTQQGSKSVPVTSYSKPFNIRVRTNALEGSSSPAETNNRGFCLQYVQQPCNSAIGK